MATDLDTLMDILPDELGEKDLDAIIAFHREQRAKRESGISTKASREAGPKQKISVDILSGLLKDKVKPAGAVVKRRI